MPAPKDCDTARWFVPAAFTLVELLVVMVIIGILIALLLPAVQAAREAARRTQCQNHLRQLGVALLNYESQQGSLPIGCVECRADVDDPRLTPWLAQLLPYLELQTLADRIDFDLPMNSIANQEAGSQLVSEFLCPSMSEGPHYSTTKDWKGRAFTDYGGIYGVEGVGRDEPDWTQPQTLAAPSLGVMLYEEPTALRHVTDGTSHTSAAAEMRTRRKPGDCEWINGTHIFAQEQDSPVNTLSGLGNGIGSPHPGGALAVFCDGHVAWLSDSIEQAALNAAMTRAGGETESIAW